MVTHPELNAKIDIMISLAPVASLAHLSSPVKVLAPYSNSIQVRQFLHNSSKRRMYAINLKLKKYLRWTRTTVFLDSNSRTRKLQKIICQSSLKTTQFCRNALFFISGADSQNFNSVDFTCSLTVDWYNISFHFLNVWLVITTCHRKSLPGWNFGQYPDSVRAKLQIRFLVNVSWLALAVKKICILTINERLCKS